MQNTKRYQQLNAKFRRSVRMTTILRMMQLSTPSLANILRAMDRKDDPTIAEVWYSLSYATADEIEKNLRILHAKAEKERIEWGFEHFQQLYEEAVANESLQPDLQDPRETDTDSSIWPKGHLEDLR